MPPAPPAALIRWEGVLVVATLALLGTVGGWLLLHLMRCSVHRWRGVRASWRTKRKLLCAPVRPLQRVSPNSGRAFLVAADDLDIRKVRLDHHVPLKKAHRRSHSAPVPRSLEMLLHSTPPSPSTPPLPPPRKPSMLEWVAGPLLRRAGSLCVLVLAMVLVPTALQLRRVLQQDGIIDTDLASFRSVTGRYTERQACALHARCMRTACTLHVHCMCTARTLLHA